MTEAGSDAAIVKMCLHQLNTKDFINMAAISKFGLSIQGVSRYVWVFTNVDTVFYIFRPTREADFLKDLLKEFTGVLISDFYTGYDSIPCTQQKCLVHLIRDMNDDLFNNQFDVEYRQI